jgi:polyphosphate kinase
MSLLNEEMKQAKAGKEAWIRLKLNNLVDTGMIDKLYRASSAGVRIQLVVRGICALKAGVPGLSQNIEVRSIVGRYLEHSRFAVFAGGGDMLVYLSSADWMTRNLDRRVEVTTPVLDAGIKTQLVDLFDHLWNDNQKARRVTEEGQNLLAGEKEDKPFLAQERLYTYYGDQK